jgi:hypothetical protein
MQSPFYMLGQIVAILTGVATAKDPANAKKLEADKAALREVWHEVEGHDVRRDGERIGISFGLGPEHPLRKPD